MTNQMRRETIESVVSAYLAAHKEECQGLKDSVNEARNTRATAFADDGKKELRLTLRLPAGLFNELNGMFAEPKFLHESEELNWFMRKFPEFTIPSRV